MWNETAKLWREGWCADAAAHEIVDRGQAGIADRRCCLFTTREKIINYGCRRYAVAWWIVTAMVILLGECI